MMLHYRGPSSFSSFKTKKLLQQLQAQVPTITEVNPQTIYFIATHESLHPDEKSNLGRLLDAKEFEPEDRSLLALVIPRFGTISTWSSKATDISKVCGFAKIERIERGIAYFFQNSNDAPFSTEVRNQISSVLHDRMTEVICYDLKTACSLFQHQESKKSTRLPVLSGGVQVLEEANTRLGLALSGDEIVYFEQKLRELQRDPTDTELMMFAQINSEHCRHKIFNANWSINNKPQSHSLFAMIRNTYQQSSQGVLSAYKDNGAVLVGKESAHFFLDQNTRKYIFANEPTHIVIKVETHNHPTAISPFSGAATGAGGEIRDEGATGIGAKPKAGLTGFSVSHLHIPGYPQPWEAHSAYPHHVAFSLEIMLQGPIGAASFNNEFGRPNLCGYFRSFEMVESDTSESTLIRGYHKPIMIAGGLGNIRQHAVNKKSLSAKTKIIVLGGPGMLIGIGGGAASSVTSGSSRADLDYASVQRSNPEMQRRCQQVIDACCALGAQNPILSIHDVGAGGLSNALPELIHDDKNGGRFSLRSIPSADSSMSEMEIWCNESQERYVLAIDSENLDLFEKIATRERCPYAIIGETQTDPTLVVYDEKFDHHAVHLPMEVLLGSPPKLHRHIVDQPSKAKTNRPLMIYCENFFQIVENVLRFPAVASKNFLITIGDRSVTGMVARDQMVGPWQIPVSDVAVTAASFNGYTGEAMAMGERTPIALLDAAASARMAVVEAITNIAAADITALGDIKLSANWMAAANHEGEGKALYEAVRAIGMELCPDLGICIPVGKDSLSMQMQWKHDNKNYKVTSPLSLIISAFAPVQDIRKTLTPQLKLTEEPSVLLLVDLGAGQNRLGGSTLAQVYQQIGNDPPDIDQPQKISAFFKAIQKLRHNNLILAYHDRSDGGLLATICEMAFAGHTGVSLELDEVGRNIVSILFNEEAGAVIQILESHLDQVNSILKEEEIADITHHIGVLNTSDEIIIRFNQNEILKTPRVTLQRLWSETSFHLQALRDNPECAQQEYDNILNDPGLQVQLSFDPNEDLIFPYIKTGVRPSVAILREQGVNGHIEMAAAFDRAGFTAIDVHMTDILNGEVDLGQFKGLVACGGFSYGDVLGAGQGWAKSILYNPIARDQFEQFLQRTDSFALGVCNGCQMFAHLRTLIPGSDLWPRFVRNHSEQFEARFSLVRVRKSPSLFFLDMENSLLPITVAHGEGKAEFPEAQMAQQALDANKVPLQFMDNHGNTTENYPANPNGSPFGITALTNDSGRITIMMPHPERVFRTVQNSWHPNNWGENAPWFRLFQNARRWVD